MKERTAPLKKWLDKITITTNVIYMDHELVVDMHIFYKLFKDDNPTLFKKECYFLGAVKLYASKVKGNPTTVETININYIALGLK